jgi:hypothetical protein
MSFNSGAYLGNHSTASQWAALGQRSLAGLGDVDRIVVEDEDD